MSVPPSAKYAIIREMAQRDNNLLNISWLCSAAGVSRSGYYHYLGVTWNGASSTIEIDTSKGYIE